MVLQNLLTNFHWRHKPNYILLETSDLENHSQESNNDVFRSSNSKGEESNSYLRGIWLYISMFSGILLIFELLSRGPFWSQTSITQSRPCKAVPIRREWRSLTTDERSDFTQAVNCLGRIPSRWTLNGTIYDDFAFLHGSIGSWCHRSSSFLPWHRYTLFVWEKTLREQCGFGGSIPYWDWTLDWMNLANSSIWDETTGFGGDGDPNGPITVGKGRCVSGGPFTELRPILYNHTYEDHCLSRGFRDGDQLGRLPGAAFSPETIGRILRKPTYKEFEREVEYRLHNVMHIAIAGDFLALTAANDPIFFLHHAQMDHLWWEWQQEKREERLNEYHGKHMFNSTEDNASVNDILLYNGFVDDIPVLKVMDTENGFLCYRY